MSVLFEIIQALTLNDHCEEFIIEVENLLISFERLKDAHHELSLYRIEPISPNYLALAQFWKSNSPTLKRISSLQLRA
jgi:hypothetical protein